MVTAKVGQLYMVANGRYLYLPESAQVVEGRLTVPLWAVAEAFDAKVGWDSATGTVTVTRGSGAIQSGESYYDQNDLFWLSRLIYAESGNQPLEGQMAVGNVVLNRVASPIYPNTIEGVLAQKNQFSTYQSEAWPSVPQMNPVSSLPNWCWMAGWWRRPEEPCILILAWVAGPLETATASP